MHMEPITPEMGVTLSADTAAAEPVPPVDEIRSLVDTHGVAVFRGFPLDLTGFYELVEQISPGIRRGVGDEHNGLRLHGEMYYLPVRIDLLWFYCVTAANKGDATTLCDGIEVVNQLSSAALRFFADNPLTFKISIPRQFWTQFLGDISAEQAAEALQTVIMGPVADGFQDGSTFSCMATSAEFVDAVFSRGAIIRTRCGDQKAFVNTLLHALDPWASSLNSWYHLTTRIPSEIVSEIEQTTERLTQELYWNPGDFAVVDNTRLLHGRRPYEGPRDIQAVNGVLPG